MVSKSLFSWKMCFSGGKNHIFWDHGYVGAWAENRGFGTPKYIFPSSMILLFVFSFNTKVQNSTFGNNFDLYSKSLKIFRVHIMEHFQSLSLRWSTQVLPEVYSKYFKGFCVQNVWKFYVFFYSCHSTVYIHLGTIHMSVHPRDNVRSHRPVHFIVNYLLIISDSPDRQALQKT